MAKRPLEIDMCSSSQLRDTQGEMLNVEGADITELEAGKGRLNDNHGKGFFNCLGKVTAAKKIFKAEDCEDDRQKYYWEKVKSPYIYVKGILFDDEDHPNAKAAAAILRNIHKTDCPLKVKASVEGGVLSRGISDPALLARTKIHSVALTFVPANQATLVEPLNLDKSETDMETDAILIKSVLHLAETNVPSFRHIVRDASAERIENNVNEIIAALGGEDAVALKQALIVDSLENKIQENVLKINELVKNAKSRRRFNPAEAIKEIDALDPDRQEGIGAWMGGGGTWQDRDAWPRAEGPTRERMLHHLYGSTQVRRADDGGREFLLHRGMGPDEFKNSMSQDHINHGQTSSWTPNQKVANTFGKDGHAVSAWVHENNIRTVPKQFGAALHTGQVGKPGPGASEEHEVIVEPNHQSLLNKALTAGYGGAGSPTSMSGGSVLQSESQELGPKNLAFITCDHCGKEQVYGKFQVKCREPNCGKAFSMAKLEKFFELQKSKKNSPEEQAKIDEFVRLKASGKSPHQTMGTGTKGHLPPPTPGTFHGQGAVTSGKIVKKGFSYENKQTGERGYGSHPQQEKHHWAWDHHNKKWNHIRTSYGSPNI